MKKLLMIVAMVAVIGMAGTANAGVYLVDFTFGGSPVATAADFTTGGVAGLAGTETTDSLAVTGGAGTLTTGGGINVTFQNAHFANYRPDWAALVAPVNLLRDFAYDYAPGGAPDANISIGNIDLDPGSNYTLYLWGHNFNVVLPGGYASTFTPVDGDVTFVSLTPTLAYLAVDFTTNAAWDDENDTIDFIWGSGPEDWNQFTGFAIVGEAVPEPGTIVMLLIGVAGLLFYRKRR